MCYDTVRVAGEVGMTAMVLVRQIMPHVTAADTGVLQGRSPSDRLAFDCLLNSGSTSQGLALAPAPLLDPRLQLPTSN